MKGLALTTFLLFACSAPAFTLPAPPLRVGDQQVRYEHRYNMGGHMAAEWRAGTPIIYFHPERFEPLPVELKYFIHAHEYCHLKEDVDGEIEADCCALAWMKGAELDGGKTLSTVVQHVYEWPKSEVHPPGSYRALAIMGCSIALSFK